MSRTAEKPRISKICPRFFEMVWPKLTTILPTLVEPDLLLMASAMLDLFKTKINRVRDILRRDGITGMDSMKHCALYLAARYMTSARVASIGVPETFAWESLVALVRTGSTADKELSRDRIYAPGIEECLVHHFDALFKTTEFNFRASAQGHADIMEALDSVALDEIESDMDLLGWVYEAHMKTNKGSSGGSRDLGQHFTDREIIQYMVNLCAPKKYKSGKIDTICDPTMGTGGMLTTAVKYLTEKYDMKREDWEFNKERILGCDIDRFLGSVGSINLFMETHGTVFPHVEARDSLLNDLRGDADVILANMPFGVKGLTHAGSCCSRVKALGLNGTKSEPLFLQLMMVALAKKGRCAVVVPDGILVNASKCHDGTRKYLLDHFEVRRVIKMKGQFFMNTSIQTNVLFFENTGKPTSAVEFWEVEKTATGELTEKLVVTVPREKFDASCTLDVRRYLEAEKPAANPAGFPMVKLGEIAFNKKYPQHDTSYGKETGSRRFHTGGVSTHLFTDTPDISETVIIVNRTNGAGKSNIFLDSNCSVAKQTLVMSCDEEITTKYLFYWLSLNKPEIEKGYIGSNHKNLSNDHVKNMIVPLPPRDIQDTIVATLDRIYNPGTTDLADTLKLTSQAMDLVLADPTGATLTPVVEAQRLIRKSAQMVADVKAQMVAIMKASSSKGQTFLLKDVCAVSFGERITQKEHKGTLYPVYGGGEANFHTNRFNREGPTCKVARFAVSEKTMVLMINDKYWLMDSGFTVTSRDKDSVTDEYLWWILWANQAKLVSCSTGSCQKNISMEAFYALSFGFPSLEAQTSVISKIKALQSQLTALESLQRQSEDNACFILESYLGAPALSEAADADAVADVSESDGSTIEHV